MDWRTIRFDWNRARAFLVTVEEGTFTAAAQALDLTQPTVGRQVAALEEELDVALFERVGNELELTPAGLELAEHVRAMGDAASRVSLSAAGQSTSVEGTVCITASEAISAFLLPTFVLDLRADHPGIEIELVVSNEARDLQRREADIAIRNFRPDQPDLIARKISDAVAHMYATPEYLERIGGVASARDLHKAELFAFDRTDVMVEGLARVGVQVEPHQFPIVTANHLVQWELCRQGAGICIMMQQIGDADPLVQRVLPDVEIPVPLWLVSHRELRTNRRIRLVFDRLALVLG
jgi:DNA-binding transcriptional LysR family regulator